MSTNLPYWVPEWMIEEALRQFFITQLPSEVNVYKMLSDEIVREPYVGVLCIESDNKLDDVDIVSAQNRVYTIQLVIRSHAVSESKDGITINDAHKSHRNLVGTIRDCIYVPDIVQRINEKSIEGFVFQRLRAGTLSRSVVENSFVTTQTLMTEGYIK